MTLRTMLAELPPAYSLLIECQLCAFCLMQAISAATCSLLAKKDAGQDSSNPPTTATAAAQQQLQLQQQQQPYHSGNCCQFA